MEIFNIGPLELLLILIIALVVLGPEDMIKTARSIAKGIRKIIRSPIWKSLIDTSQEIKELPRKFIREAGLEESIEDLKHMSRFPETDLTIGPPTKTNTGTESEQEIETQETVQTNENILPVEAVGIDSLTDKNDLEQDNGEKSEKDEEDEEDEEGEEREVQ